MFFSINPFLFVKERNFVFLSKRDPVIDLSCLPILIFYIGNGIYSKHLVPFCEHMNKKKYMKGRSVKKLRCVTVNLHGAVVGLGLGHHQQVVCSLDLKVLLVTVVLVSGIQQSKY